MHNYKVSVFKLRVFPAEQGANLLLRAVPSLEHIPLIHFKTKNRMQNKLGTYILFLVASFFYQKIRSPTHIRIFGRKVPLKNS